MAPEDTRAAVLRLIEADPSLPLEMIGKAVGVSRQRVHRILTEEGYRPEWRKAPPTKKK